MDLLVAADQCQQGNGGVGESSWQGHDGSPRESVAGELVCSYAVPNLTQMHAGRYDFMGYSTISVPCSLKQHRVQSEHPGGRQPGRTGFWRLLVMV